MVIRATPEKKEERERVRLALFRATLHLAAAHGFPSLSLREVAREALIAPTSFYRHFEDMEELGLALVEEKVGPLVQEWTKRMQATASDQAHRAKVIVGAILVSLQEDPELLHFLFAQRVAGSPRLRAAIEAIFKPFREGLEEVLERELGDGGRAPDIVGAAIAAIVSIALDGGFRALEVPPRARTELRAQITDQVRMIMLGAKSLAAEGSATCPRRGD